MEPVLFYGVPQGCSFGSIVALEWTGAPYRLCRIDMPGGVSHPVYSRINPARETPALVLESGRTISESLAILNHIAARGIDRKLGFVQGTFEFDRLNETLSYLVTTLFASFGPLWKAYEMADPDPTTQEVLRAVGRKEVTKAFGHIEALLAGRDWLAGTPDRTVADAYFLGIARWGDYHHVLDRAAFPRVDRFMRKLEADPAVQFAHAIEDERPAVSSGGFRGHIGLGEIEPRLAA